MFFLGKNIIRTIAIAIPTARTTIADMMMVVFEKVIYY
jgi:hypothetical protein